MRLVIVLAGILGFLSVVIVSLAWGKPVEKSIVSGVLVALVSAVLSRWWMKVWLSNWQQASQANEAIAMLGSSEEADKGQQSQLKPGELRKP